MTAAPGPLDGLVVCDLSTVLAGPYCSMLLGDLGADVIKVEPPDGDPTRRYGPPFVPPARRRPESAPVSRATTCRSTATSGTSRLDIGTPAGAAVLERLLAASDVLIENFRPGSLERMGFDDARLEAINPRLVRLSITGYGPTGPDSDRPGFDFIIQAVSGLMSITGMPDAEGGAPTKVGVAIADLTTGMLGAVAILAALRWRDGDGSRAWFRAVGQRIDSSLLGVRHLVVHQPGDQPPHRWRGADPDGQPAPQHHALRDVSGERRRYRRGGRLRAAVASTVRGAGTRRPGARCAVRDQRRAGAAPGRSCGRSWPRAFGQRTAAEWETVLVAADVPVGQVRDMAQVFADPQVVAGGMVVDIDHPTVGPIRLPGLPWQLHATPGSVRRAPPTLGQDTDALLDWLGFGADEVADDARGRRDLRGQTLSEGAVIVEAPEPSGRLPTASGAAGAGAGPAGADAGEAFRRRPHPGRVRCGSARRPPPRSGRTGCPRTCATPRSPVPASWAATGMAGSRSSPRTSRPRSGSGRAGGSARR